MPNTSASLRIVLVTTKLHFGGAEKALVNIAEGLSQRGFEPTVIALASKPEANRARLLSQLEQNKIPTHLLGLDHPSKFIQGRRRLKKLLNELQPQAILSFLFHANVLTHLANRASVKVPQVIGVRVADPIRWRAWVERRVARHSLTKKVTCVSDSVRQYVKKAGYPADKLVVIPNGVEVRSSSSDPHSSVTQEESTKWKRVLLLGRLDPQKGTKDLPRLFELCWQQDPDIVFELVGDGPLLDWIRQQHNEQEWGSRVTIHGFVREPQEQIRACSLLLLPSLWEGMPNALLEAMANSKPVAAFDVEGVRQVLRHSDSNQIASPGDLHELASIVSQTLSEKQVAIDRGKQNRMVIDEFFSLDSMIDSYASLLKTIANS